MARRSLERWKEMGAHGALDDNGDTIYRLAEAKAFFREILDRYEPRELVSQDGDHDWLMWLVKGHYNYDQLCPAGADHFVVHSNRDIGHVGNDKGFSVVAKGSDGPVPFSMMRALRGVPKDPNDKLELAMRALVKHQLMRWFADTPDGKWRACPVTGAELVPEVNLYIHYALPFPQLMEEFFAAHDIDEREVEVDEFDRGDHFEWRLVGELLREKWNTYHWEHMEVRYLSITGHFQLEAERLERQRADDAKRKYFMGLRVPLNYDPRNEVVDG